MTSRRTIFFAVLVLAACTEMDNAADTAPAATGAEVASESGINPYLFPDSAYRMTHFDTASSDVSEYPMPQGFLGPDDVDVRYEPFGLLNWSNLHMAYPDGIEIMWLASPQMVGKFRIDGEHFELIDTDFPPGVEDLQSTRAITAKLRQDLLEVHDDDVKTRQLWNEAVIATRAYNYNNAFYAISDLDGHFFVPYGMGIYKFGNVDQDDPLSKIEVKGYFDALQHFPKELVENATGLMGVSMTNDGFLLLTLRDGALGVMDRDFKRVVTHTFPGERIENGMATDGDGGIYVVTDKNMYKLIWNGKRLSQDSADGAWSSPYNTSDELVPGTNAPGSGTTPTLIGLGPDEDKLVVIADYGQTVNAVAFWADDIPEDFEQKPGTLSRRIAGQREMKNILGTLDSSFVGYGNGFVGVNQVAPSVSEEANPALSILASALTMGVTRPAPVGIQKRSEEHTSELQSH